MCRFPVKKNKQQPLWINICFRPVKLTSVSAALWKLETCIVFFADVYASFRSRALFFVRVYSFLQYSTIQKPLLCLQQILIIKAPFACKQTKIRLSHATRYKTTKHRSLVTNTKQPYTVSVYQNIKKPYVVSHETNHQTIQPAGSNKTSQSLWSLHLRQTTRL